MKYFSMFSGIGGFELGITQAYEDCRLGLPKQEAKNLRKVKPNIKGKQVRRPVCVGYSEIDKHAIKIYEKQFKKENCLCGKHAKKRGSNGKSVNRANRSNGQGRRSRTNDLPNCAECFQLHKNYGDCTAIKPARLPDFDLICAGFPCQSFSIAGKRGGFADTRGTLFFEIARIARAKKPRYLLLENVKGLLSHDEGNTFATIICTLDELGYDCQWQVLNSKDFGVPQNRERVFMLGHKRCETITRRQKEEHYSGNTSESVIWFKQGSGQSPSNCDICGKEMSSHDPNIIGHLRGTRRPKVFPIEADNSENAGIQSTQDQQGAWVPCLNTRYGQRWSGEGYIGVGIKQVNQPKHSNDRVYDPKGISPTLNTMQGGRRQPKIAGTLTAYGKPELKKQLPKVSDTRGFDQAKSWDYPEVFGETSQAEKELLNMILKKRRTKESREPEKDGSAVKVEDIEFAKSLVVKGYLVDEGDGWFDLARRSGKVNDAEKVFGSASIRRLTPVECERLQGFPDGWTEGVSDTQRYKCLGNAVTVNVVREIAKRLIQLTA